VATIDGTTGTVTAIAPGEATITVTTTDGGLTATCEVTVPAVSVDGVSLDQQTLSLVLSASATVTATLTATVSPAMASDKSVTWSSDNSAVATVDNTGLVTAVPPGSAMITVTTTDGGFTAHCDVTVARISVTSVTLDKSTMALVAGTTGTLTATVAPSNATDPSITWSSSDNTVATVSATGVVTAVGTGSATITVTTTDGGLTATCAVKTGVANTLLVNPGFEDPADATTTIASPWVAQASTPASAWFTAFFGGGLDPLGDMRPGAGTATAPNRASSTDATLFPATGAGNGTDLIPVVAGNFVGRINGGQGGFVYQLVNVTPGTTYGFGATVGYRANSSPQVIRSYESLKILSADGLTVYGWAKIDTSNPQQSPSAAYAKFVIVNVSGTVTIPAGVTQVRFQLDQRNGIDATLTGAPGGATAPLMFFDQCFMF